jgi:tRNA/rRNA methyltransferase
MAGTDRSLRDAAARQGGPAIVLVEPQLGENIGAAARAMLNFDLTDLRLVRPRDGWPSAAATANAAGADEVLEAARLYDGAGEAIAGLNLVYAATARPRDMVKEVVTPAEAARRLREAVACGEACGVLFGRESIGLDNDTVALADAVLTVPSDPGFASLNLAMAVLLVAYEWFKASDATPEAALSARSRPATKGELAGLFEHLEAELDACGFLRVREKRPSMVRNLRNILQRARLTEQEVRTLRGVVTGLAEHGRRFGRGAGNDSDGTA